MKITNQPVELIVQVPPVFAKSKKAGSIQKSLHDAGIPVTSISRKSTRMPPAKKMKTKALPADTSQNIYVKTKIRDAEMNPWDVAHMAARSLGSQAYTEPDLVHEYTIDNNADIPYKKSGSKAPANPDGFDPDWQPHKNKIWHLGDDYSQLKSAREEVTALPHLVRIGHIDTGYNATHAIIDSSIRQNKLQRSFVEEEDQLDAHDRYTQGTLRMPGHGTGTLGILAGSRMKLNTDDGVFNDYIGGAYFADIVCCRISSSVVLIKTSAFAEALQYLVKLTTNGYPVHVVSMSMGGAPSHAWADAVNAAYEAGITVVTAAGNHFNGLPTRHVIYPARFERVIAACGVTYDFKPYVHQKLGEMQGCYGPERHMDKALAAFTPNTPWAAGNAKRIMYSGAGTSSATPQVAAAAAIYYRKYYTELNALQPWQRVEAIRYALFRSASKKGIAPGPYWLYFGNGIIQAKKALSIPVNSALPKTPADKMPWFPILTTIFKSIPGNKVSAKLSMFNTELSQLVYQDPVLRALIDHEEKPFERISKKKWKAFADAVIEHPAASIALKQYLMATHM